MSAVAVLGARGAVGRAAVAWLRAAGVGTVREGSRATGVDVFDEAGLAAFCAGASVVLNCAGPASAIQDRVAAAAARAGAHYVDAAGDEALLAQVSTVDVGAPDGWTAVLSAGMMPGLTGILPRYLMSAGATELEAYVGGRDRFTRTAALDYLTEGFGEPLASWRDGAYAPRSLQPETDVAVPYFPEPVTVQPFLSTETRRVAVDLGLTEVRWYSVFAGTRVLNALRGAVATEEAADRLRRAADLDLFGHQPYQLIVVTLSGGGSSHTVAVRADGASALTGAVAAYATREVWAGRVPPGVQHADTALDPTSTLDTLAAGGALTVVPVFEEDTV